MNTFLAAFWGLSGALVAAGIALARVCRLHNAYPWELIRDAKTGKQVKAFLSKEELKAARLRYFVMVAVMGAVGAASAACAASGGSIRNPISAIVIGFGVRQVPRLFALNIALAFESWVLPRLGDAAVRGVARAVGGRDHDASAPAPLPAAHPDETEATRR
jgi:diacylglycerol kinase family enzyme